MFCILKVFAFMVEVLLERRWNGVGGFGGEILTVPCYILLIVAPFILALVHLLCLAYRVASPSC